MEITVRSGLVTACRLATWPIRRSPSFVKATTEGVVRLPSAFAITVGCPPSMTATQLFVVPRSIPIILLIIISSVYSYCVFPLYLSESFDSSCGPVQPVAGRCCVPLFRNDFHHRVAKNFISHAIPFLQHLTDCPGFPILRCAL